MRDGFVKIACCVPPVQVADVSFNVAQTVLLARDAARQEAKIAVFPELGITAYSCQDLFFQRQLLQAAQSGLLLIAEQTAALDMLMFIGLPLAVGARLFDVTAAVYGGKILAVIPKTHISGDPETHEKRYFTSGVEASFDSVQIGKETVPFGTDILLTHSKLPELRVAAEVSGDLKAPYPPSVRHALAGATVIVNSAAFADVLTADVYHRSLVCGQSARLISAYAYCSCGSGESTQDAVYTGHSLICENGTVCAERDDIGTQKNALIVTEVDVRYLEDERRKTGLFSDAKYRTVEFGRELVVTELTRPISGTPFIPENDDECAARCEKTLALQALGLKKRIEHTNAKCVVLGLSGGLDSSLALLVCVRAMAMLKRQNKDILVVTMPCFGTTKRTRGNAEKLASAFGCTLKVVQIGTSVTQHFTDIGHDPSETDSTYENAQARERTQVLMDLAGQNGGFVVGTGDLSELALGWTTYNGDHMSMYGVNASVPKTLIRRIIFYAAQHAPANVASILRDILDTPVSPELLPPQDGEIAQKTEELVGPYELNDFFLYYSVRRGFEPRKIERLARRAFAGVYDNELIVKCLTSFYRRFFSQQYKRSCLPDGPKIGTLGLSPRSAWQMPSDAVVQIWLRR